MSILPLIQGILVFGVVVFIHEMGHFMAARAFGVGVHEFSLGFGPALRTWNFGGTRWCLRPVPLGGYVQVAGMEGEDEGEPAKGRLFVDIALWQKVVILAAGSIMNVALALLIWWATLFAYGAGDTVIVVAETVRSELVLGTVPSGSLVAAVAVDDRRLEAVAWPSHQEFLAKVDDARARDGVFEFSKQKLDGTFRIMILGDSFAFGEGVRWEDTFGYQLREIFILDAPTQYIEVVNLSVGGWATTDEITYLEHEGATFDPDLVIVIYVMNDANHAGGLDLWDNFREQYEASGLVRRSYFASFVYARVMRHVYGRRYIRGLVDSALSEPELWAASMDELSRGAQIAQRMGAGFAVVIFPFMYHLDESYPLHELHDLVRSHCESQEIPVLDLFDAFEGRSYADLWVHPTDQHPNEIGHRIAAEAIAQFLNQSGLLSGSSQEKSPSRIRGKAGS
ncbi:site-2 protease family protein [bacterium]|nr:site-2 protease family protein [bacterium]